LLILGACSPSDGTLREGFESGRYRTVVAFGDSIVEGYGVREGWPEMLQRSLSIKFPGVRVINAGHSGDTAKQGLARVEKSVISNRPDLVLVSFGLNDMKDGVRVVDFKGALTEIVARLENAGSEVVLMTTTRLQRGAGLFTKFDPAPFNEAIRGVAVDTGVRIIDVIEETGNINTPEYLLDAAHPNAEGYRKLAGIIEKGLLR